MVAKTRPCEICMKPIDAERCAANPKTRLCIEHANQIRKYGGEFRIISYRSRNRNRRIGIGARLQQCFDDIDPSILDREYEREVRWTYETATGKTDLAVQTQNQEIL